MTFTEKSCAEFVGQLTLVLLQELFKRRIHLINKLIKDYLKI